MTPAVWSEVDDQKALMNRLLAEITQASDTHPALQDRLRAIGQVPQWRSAPRASAADEFFGQARQELTRKLASEWRAERGPDWRRRHEEILRRRARLVELEAMASVSAEQSFEWGTLLEDDGRDDAALGRYQSAHAAGHVAAGFAAGRRCSIAMISPALR